MAEFFGFGGYQRPAEGFLSWQHLTFVTLVMLIMVIQAVYWGSKNNSRSEEDKNKVIMFSAFLMDGVELFKIIIICIRGNDPMAWLYHLPLFVCSIQMITLPLAAFSKGRIRQASLDFICMFGLIGAILGTYGAGNNYSCYPVLSLENVVSAITHGTAGFAALYILIAGMTRMRKENLGITFAILLGFVGVAYTANVILDYNYMFLVRGDGTPYDILYNWVGGNPILYPIGVVGLFVIYILAFYKVFALVQSKKKKPVVSEA